MTLRQDSSETMSSIGEIRHLQAMTFSKTALRYQELESGWGKTEGVVGRTLLSNKHVWIRLEDKKKRNNLDSSRLD